MIRLRTALVLALGITAAFAAVAPARAAQPIQLKFADPGAPGDWIQKAIEAWAARVKDATHGLVDVKVYPGGTIGNFRNVYDRLLNGVADAAFGALGRLQDQYPRSSVSNLPFLTDRSSVAGRAMWQLYSDGVITKEFKDIKLIALFGFGVSGLHFVEPAKSLDDLRGLKILVNGRSDGKLVELLGATPISSNPAVMYQSLSRGLAQGIDFTYTGLVAFHLYDLLKYHLEAPFGTTIGFYAFNKQSFARLPETAQKEIDSVSGLAETVDMGKRADAEDARTRALVLKGKGQVTIHLPPAQIETMKKRFEPFTEDWVKSTPDGAAVLAAYRKATEEAK